MTSPEFRTQSNLTGDALGPNEPERDTSEVIIIGEDSRAITFDTSYLSQEEVTQLAALQQRVRARQEAASPLDTRQANSLVEAVVPLHPILKNNVNLLSIFFTHSHGSMAP